MYSLKLVYYVISLISIIYTYKRLWGVYSILMVLSYLVIVTSMMGTLFLIVGIYEIYLKV